MKSGSWDESDGTSVVDFDGYQFTYSTGYGRGSYYSNQWSGSATVIPYDNDGDGLDTFVDCNDSDATLGSTATDIPYDGIDQDCDGVDATVDDDGDGVNSDVDCDDSDASAYPGATEIPNDGIDQDCDGSDFVDADGDGYEASLDCDDNDASAYTEIPSDEIDQDCNGSRFCRCGWRRHATVDCNDNDASIYPGATEILGDGIDQDCDGIDQTVTCPAGEIADCQGNDPAAGLETPIAMTVPTLTTTSPFILTASPSITTTVQLMSTATVSMHL